jgi:iron complex outermembrane receptor protein
MTATTHRRDLRRALLAGLATATLAMGPLAHAAPAQTIRLAAGPLDAALRQLAAETHEQLLFSPEMVAGRRAPAVSGQLTTEQALAQLLAATDLSATRVGPAVLVLRASPAGAAPAASAAPRPAGQEAQTGRPFVAERGDETAPGFPPTRPADARPPSSTTVTEIQVTGTHIRGAGAGASPLVALERRDLDNLGHLTVAAALGALPQNFNGQDTEQTAATGTDHLGVNTTYGTGVNLRGLGSDATLVLVNGRRLGGAGAKGDFTDVSTLPSIAVARVDILLDGASAIYGSDAVGGVVNVILRRDLDGGEARVQAGVGAGGAPDEQQLGIVEGHTWRGGGVLVAYEAYRRTALAAADRAFTASADLRPLGGSDFRQAFSHPGTIFSVNPATGVNTAFAIPAGQNGLGLTPASFQAGTANLGNQRAGTEVLPDQERQSLYLAAHQELSDRIEVTGDVLYGVRRARATIAAPATILSVSKADPFFVSPNGAASQQIDYAFTGDLPPPIARASAATLAVTAGAKIRLSGDWQSESFLDASQEIERVKANGILNSTILAEALGNVADRPTTAYSPARDGFFNPYTGQVANTPAVLAAIGSGFTNARRRSRVLTISSQADGSLFDLPGGPLKLAVGGQARVETFVRSGTNYTSTVAPVAQAGTNVDRTVGALFAELRAPLVGPQNRRPGLERLEVSAALRWEHYSDFGGTTNPKVGLLWSPVDDLSLRTTFGRSFRAPGLRELHDPAVYGPVLLPLGPVKVLSLLLNGGNPGLRPETADSWTVGADWRPRALPGLRVSLSGFDVQYQNRIDTPVTATISTALSDPAVANFVRHLDPANGADLAAISALLASPALSTAQGSFPPASYGAIIDGRYVNTGKLKVQGIDVDAAYGADVAQGRLSLDAHLSDLLRYEQQLTPTGSTLERVGVVGFPAKLRGRFAADWTRETLTLGAAVNRTSAFHDTAGVHVGALTTVDLRLALTGAPSSRWAGTTLGVNVRNLFDKAPPFYNNPLGFGFDGANADVIGRFVSVQLTKSW